MTDLPALLRQIADAMEQGGEWWREIEWRNWQTPWTAHVSAADVLGTLMAIVDDPSEELALEIRRKPGGDEEER